MDRWQGERNAPAFTLMSGDLCQGLDPEMFELAIVGAVSSGVLPGVLKTLELSGNPAVFVFDEGQPAHLVRQAQAQGAVIRQHEAWAEHLITVSSEILRRCAAVARSQRAEQTSASLERQATLGRYALEMRHTLNNALTSVLGNSELLLLEPALLSARARSQVETIHNMALRMHEVLQRFSSLDKELNVVAMQAEKESTTRSARAAATGS